MFKKIGIGILIALMVAAIGVGVATAQEPTSPAETPAEAEDPIDPQGGRGGHGMPGDMGGGHLDGRASLDTLAEALGMTVDELREALANGQTVAELAEAQDVALEDIADALVAAQVERLQQAVEDGRLTQEEADERLAEMKTDMLEHLESGELGGPGGPGDRGGHGMPGGMPGGMGGGQLDGRASLDTLAEALGMTVDELREALADGQMVADLAEAQDVALEDIADALVAAQVERLQQAVEDGRLTQEEANEKLAEMRTDLLEHLESGELVGLGGPGECGGPGGMGGGPRGGEFRGHRFSDSEAPTPEE